MMNNKALDKLQTSTAECGQCRAIGRIKSGLRSQGLTPIPRTVLTGVGGCSNIMAGIKKIPQMAHWNNADEIEKANTSR